ncbi:CsbD family protein [Synechococcus sp. H55.10]
MSIQDRIEATAKNLEGKIQEAVGELTGDEKQKLEGKAKQMEAAAQHAKEDLKDAVKEGVDNLLG